jgi:hypothetical protein
MLWEKGPKNTVAQNLGRRRGIFMFKSRLFCGNPKYLEAISISETYAIRMLLDEHTANTSGLDGENHST